MAAKRGIELRSHGELYKFVARLKDEMNDPELATLFSVAAALHQNFYENWLPPEIVVHHGEAVKHLVKKLEAVVNREGDNK